jgi:predicted Rossmann fold flavoprotein
MTDIKTYDVIVLGAGASGLFCALTAGKRGLSVLVLERANKIGKKILMSGGGRCNFTNYDVNADNFICQNPHFVKSALSQYSQWDFIGLVADHSIAYEERKHGQLFCLDSAKDILNMLLGECQKAGVEIKSRCETQQITALEPSNHMRYKVTAEHQQSALELQCRNLVIATGALSIPTLGGSGYGYNIAEQFSLPLINRSAGLVPLTFSDHTKAMCERLSGLALEVDISCNNTHFTESLLFTHRGISGPAVLQISNYWTTGSTVGIDLLPQIDASSWLLELKRTRPRNLLRSVLQQELAKPLTLELQQLWWPTLADQPLADFADKQLSELGKQLNDWQLKPSGTEGYRTAEVTLGGIDTDSISSKTMQVNHQAGLYFIGEVLDVSGHLGGFNFQWAWSSGYAAGNNIL